MTNENTPTRDEGRGEQTASGDDALETSDASRAFPLLPLRNAVLFPGQVATLPLGRRRSIDLARAVTSGDVIGVVVQRDPRVENPAPSDLHQVGTRARVTRVFQRNRRLHILLEGLDRFRLTGLTQSDPYWMATGAPAELEREDDRETKIYADALREQLAGLSSDAKGQLGELLDGELEEEPGPLADSIAAAMSLSLDDSLEVLFTLDVLERLRVVTDLVVDVQSRAEVKSKIEKEVREAFSKNQREALLREQLRAIKKELGDDEESELERLRKKLDETEFPEEAQKAVDREFKRLDGMNPNLPDYNVIRNYLDWMVSLPWTERAQDTLDLDRVNERLEADHYGLDDVKKRILEHMAVLQIAGEQKGTILCFAGPPGVGKTSLGQSIAAATDRPFVRISLGGVRDEAELRGHRRTYIGALPGRIIHAMKKAGVKNPVILLDEIDKLSRGWSGDPAAALLEVLDPEQNNTFTDHYIEQPFDLSEVLFICTVNNLGELSPPLRDRLEVIEISGYTPDEKVQIGRRHLVPAQREQHSLDEETLTIDADSLMRMVREYTREAGVRQLNREIQKICRGVALEVVRGRHRDDEAEDSDEGVDDDQGQKDVEKKQGVQIEVTPDGLEEYLGKPKFFEDVRERTAVAGVATGLAYTTAGGDILFIETTRMAGKGKLEITGSLGDVMQESARAALAYVRTNADRLGVDENFLENSDLHIHVPKGAVPKDGPSAGVTIFTALTSLLTGRRVRSDTAMTGEVTLRGRVLPVGGVKSKVLAAHRAGIEQVILPKRNKRDLDEVPDEVREAMTFIFAQDMGEVLEAALEEVIPAGTEIIPEAAGDATGATPIQ